jgi:hypothetical protein
MKQVARSILSAATPLKKEVTFLAVQRGPKKIALKTSARGLIEKVLTTRQRGRASRESYPGQYPTGGFLT